MPHREYQAHDGPGRARPPYRGRDDRDDDRPREYGSDPDYDDGRRGRDYYDRPGDFLEGRERRMDDMRRDTAGWREEAAYGRERDDDRRPDGMSEAWRQTRGQRSTNPPGGEQSLEGPHRGKGPRGYARGDDRIREDVCNRLTDDAFLDASEIEVEVKDGEVTLTGTVRERTDKRRAEDVAEAASAVKHVQNNLRVKPSGTAAGEDENADRQQAGATQTRNAKR